MEAATLPHSCCPVIGRPPPPALGAEEREVLFGAGLPPGQHLVGHSVVFRRHLRSGAHSGPGPGLGHPLISCDCRGRDKVACWSACRASKAFKPEAAGEMEKEQAGGLCHQLGWGPCSESWLCVQLPRLHEELSGAEAVVKTGNRRKCIMSFHQAKLANSLKMPPCPQHPSGLWCTPATAVSSASREHLFPAKRRPHLLSVPGPYLQAGYPLLQKRAGRNQLRKKVNT